MHVYFEKSRSLQVFPSIPQSVPKAVTSGGWTILIIVANFIANVCTSPDGVVLVALVVGGVHLRDDEFLGC